MSGRTDDVSAGDATLAKVRRLWPGRIPVTRVLVLGAAVLSVVAYTTVQRGPIHALDCVITDDFFVDVERPQMTLGEFQASVKHDTRNCVQVRVVSGPTDDDAIVMSPTETKWIFYRGDYDLEVQTVSAQG